MSVYSIIFFGVLAACIVTLCIVVYELVAKVSDLRVEIAELQLKIAKAETDNTHRYIFILDEMVSTNKILTKGLKEEKSESE